MTDQSRASCLAKGEPLCGPCRLGPAGIALSLLLTAAYLLLLILFPRPVRLVATGTFLLGAAIVWNPRPASWIYLLPLVFLLGGRSVSLGVFNPAILTMVTFAFFAIFGLDMLVWNTSMPKLGVSGKLLFSAVLVQAASIAISIHFCGQHPWNALREGSGIFMFIPLVIIVPQACRDRESIRRLIRALVLTLLVAAASGVLEYMSITGFSRIDISLGYVYRGRVASLLGNANVFAGYLELMIPVALAMAFTERKWVWRSIALAAAALGILSVLYTFSRGGLLFMAIGCGAVFIYRFRRRLWLPVVIGAVFLGLLVQNAQLFQRQMSFFLNPAESLIEPSLLHRYITYRGYVHQFTQAPVSGVGWGADEFYWGGTKIYSFWEVRHQRSTYPIEHFGGLNNLVLNHMVKGGLISLAALLLVLAAVVAAAVSAIRAGSDVIVVAITSGILALLGHQLVDNLLSWTQISSIFWLLVGLLCACASVSRRRAGT